jgi:hypothetical protein
MTAMPSSTATLSRIRPRPIQFLAERLEITIIVMDVEIGHETVRGLEQIRSKI